MRLTDKNHKVSYLLFWMLVSIAYCGVYTVAEFAVTPINGFRSFMVCAAQWAVVSFFAAALLQLISLSRIIFAITFTPLCLLSTISVYYFVTTGTGISATSIELAAVNDASMCATVVTPTLICLLAITLITGIAASVIRWKFVRRSGKRIVAVLCLIDVVAILMPAYTTSRIRRAVGSRMPYAIYFASNEYLNNRSIVSDNRDTYTHTAASADTTSVDVFFVIGEALRADHLSLNGYGRLTMPKLSREGNLVSFDSIYTDYTHTFVSVPAIMTRNNPDTPDARFEEQSFITLMNNAGYRSAWFANQDLSASYIYFAHEVDSLVTVNASRSLNSFAPWLDSDLVPHIEKWLAAGEKGQRSLAVIHTIGSHWWYGAHYTDRKGLFKPDADSREVSALSREQLINSYDNTILATDEFLGNLIDMLRERTAVLIYYSDHGESLGENGIYFHAADCEPLHHPAALIWWSDSYERAYPEKTAALRSNRHRNTTTASAFHTVLDATAITTAPLDTTLSLVRQK